MSYILKALRRAEAERAKGSIPGLSARHAPEAEGGRRLWPWLLVGAMAINAAIIIFAIWPSGVMSDKKGGDFGILSRATNERPTAPVPEWQRPEQQAATTAPQAANGAAPRPIPGQAQAATDPRLFATAEDGAEGSASRAGTETAARLLPAARDADPEPVDWMNEPPSKPAAVAPDEAPPPNLGLTDSDSLPLPQPKPLTVAAQTLLQQDFGQESLTDLSDPPLGQQPDFPEEDFADDDFADEEADFARELEVEEQARLARLQPPAEPRKPAETASPPNPYADLPVYWQMPHDFRAQVPKLKLAVHVFSPENAGRFVIIDRRRYREGDEVSDGMMLEAILPNGVVFDFQGQRFRMEHQ